MLQAPIFDSLSFDPFTLLDDGLRPAEVGIGRCDVVQALVIALMVVMLDYRRSSGDTAVVDVDCRQLTWNPTEAVQSVYTAAGMAFPTSVRTEIADWTAKNPKGKRGVNSYNLEDYGLDRDAVEAGFADYRRAFNIPLEGA